MNTAALTVVVCAAALCVDSASAQAPRPEVDAARYAQIVGRYQSRVPLWKLLRAATGGPPTRSDSISRGKLRGLLPQIRIGGRFRKGNDFLQVQSDDTGRLNLSADEQFSVDVELRFSLDRLVYDDSEPRLLRQNAVEQEAWRAQRLKIIELYFEWIELSVARDQKGSATFAEHSHINRIAARLNLFTRGAFFRMIRARRATYD